MGIFHLSSRDNHIWAYLFFLNISKFNSLNKHEDQKVSCWVTKMAWFSSVAQQHIHWFGAERLHPGAQTASNTIQWFMELLQDSPCSFCITFPLQEKKLQVFQKTEAQEGNSTSAKGENS